MYVFFYQYEATNVCGEGMHECVCLHMWTYMWKPGVDVKCHPQSLSTLYTEQSLSLLHRAQRYWNSGQPACFRDILSPFLLRSSLSLRFTSPQTGYVSWLVNPGNLPVSTFTTLELQVCTTILGSLQGCLTQVLPHVCMANMFTKLAISQLPNASFLLVSFLAPRANAYANGYEYMLLSFCVLC